ncbi:transcriptional regulator GutM [Propionicimonas sp.]|uniref:transcriptional regulator GutM n=1 Tax=Propionicimonas sp. TaxID=1955623 RepID=UPI0039E5307D
MDWRFPALLLGAMVLSIVLSLWQHRRYLAVLNEMAKANAGRSLKLVSGRGKGRLRGAIVILLVDPAARQVVDARVMTGATIFSRLRPAPELQGTLDDVVERTSDKHLRRAIEAALGMLPGATAAPGALADRTATGRIRIPRAQGSPS